MLCDGAASEDRAKKEKRTIAKGFKFQSRRGHESLSHVTIMKYATAYPLHII